MLLLSSLVGKVGVVSVEPSLNASPLSVASSGSVEVTVSNGPGNLRDWVGLYEVGVPDLLDWLYLNNSKTAPTTPITDAVLTFTMPATAGEYVFRFFPDDQTSPILAESQVVTVVSGAAFAETFSAAYDSKTAADPIDAANVSVPGGANRVLLDLLAVREDVLADTLDPVSSAVALTKIADSVVPASNTISEAWQLLEAAPMPAAANYTLQADLAATSQVFRQVVALEGASQTTTTGTTNATATTQLVVTATRASGTFPAGSIVYAIATDGQGGITYSVSGDAAIVRQDSSGWSGAEGHCFAKGTLGAAKSPVSVTFDLSGTANRISAVIVVVEPAP